MNKDEKLFFVCSIIIVSVFMFVVASICVSYNIERYMENVGYDEPPQRTINACNEYYGEDNWHFINTQWISHDNTWRREHDNLYYMKKVPSGYPIHMGCYKK